MIDAVMIAATQAGGAAAGPTELFPDPTLADTGNGALWSAGVGVEAANGGAGPDILVNNPDSDGDGLMSLAGAYETALLASWGTSQTKTVQLTVGSLDTPGSIFVRSRVGSLVEFSFAANGSVSHSVTSGEDTVFPFLLAGPSGGDGGQFTITAISVT